MEYLQMAIQKFGLGLKQKKLSLAVLIVLFILTIALYLISLKLQMKSTITNNTLYFNIIASKDGGGHVYSLDPKDSDVATNQLILNSLVGTLMKYGNSGKIEPYLAHSVEASTDQLKWVFKLRENLVCQDGSRITAYSFKQNLERRIRLYQSQGSALEFEKLVNWESFVSGGDLSGIQATDESTLVFSFSKKPNQLLEFLRMPYFGYWCDKNFKSNTFVGHENFISSGAYQVISNEDDKILTVELRKDWFSATDKSPKFIIFKGLTLDEVRNQKKNSITHLGVNTPNNLDKDNFNLIYGVPTLLTSLVVSPFKEGPFKDSNTRHYLFSKLFYSNFKAHSFNRIRAKGFVIGNDGIKPDIINYPSKYQKNSKIQIAIGTLLASEDIEPIKQSITAVFPDVEVQFVYPDKTNKEWRAKLLSNKEYDARVATVDAGGSFLNSNINMIFCSELGVKYPDSSGRICKLVKEYNNADKEVDSEYISRFNKILTDDACVIPIYWGSVSWVVSKNIDIETLPPSALYIQFENVKINE